MEDTGNSLEFCKKRIKEQEHSAYKDRNFSLAEECDEGTFELLRAAVRFNSMTNLVANWNDSIHYSIEYNPQSQFDYFASESIISDGAIYFRTKAIMDVIDRVAQCQTYYIPKGAPTDGDFIKYTVGNVVFIEEYGDYGQEGKRWLNTRITVMLPIKYEVKRA